MTNSVDDQTPLSLKDVLEKYLQYYDQVWSEGSLKVCSETQVADEARRKLSSEEELRKRFITLDVYQTLHECVQYRDCQRHIQGFIKALKLLEMFCVNLFMFPWKKEIKTLKTFTGHFVYYIKPILPFAKSILQSIGYCIETDTEYRLSDNFDTDKAKRMGFDIFLARLECEYLLELMSQRSHVECLEILRNRAASLNFNAGDDVSVQINDTCNLNEEVFKNNGHVEGGSLVNPEENPNMGLDKSQDTISDTDRLSSSFMTDDKSILEMQENYPDLAIRQKPIFQKPQTSMHHPLKVKELDGCKGHNVAIVHEVSTDMSGPQSINMHTETTTGNTQLHIPNAGVETQPSDDKSLVLRVRTLLEEHNCEGSTEDLLVELTDQMGKLHMKEPSADESLKYPIEETAQAQPCSGNTDLSTAPPTKSPDAMGFPILCNPSQEPVCNITGCDRCVGSDVVLTQDNTIKEPPQSIYIPSSLSGCPLALGPPTDDNQTTNDGSSVQLHRSPTSRHPEDDLLQTYVMV
ncbi:uncharacterized protein si:ch211-189a15.5 [Myxocyprinus asiaticus]|uniref:uncharacterized protein si:ch211-189a15.5 n=1 Tax=Myxocyprinus asiaticus TaxID=70543 RepID=UPI0022234C12|nr:uncharacterized protein si:ch211-189a15.5 [Myxocyprinus asiaticus]